MPAIITIFMCSCIGDEANLLCAAYPARWQESWPWLMAISSPTLRILKQHLTELQQRSENHLILCGPLVVALKDDISKRFELLLVQPDVQLAAVVHPRLKLDWMTDDVHKSSLTEQLKRRVRALGNSRADQTSQWSVTEDTDASDFFARISAARKHRTESTGDDAGS